MFDRMMTAYLASRIIGKMVMEEGKRRRGKTEIPNSLQVNCRSRASGNAFRKEAIRPP
jgi:hypothetical protein